MVYLVYKRTVHPKSNYILRCIRCGSDNAGCYSVYETCDLFATIRRKYECVGVYRFVYLFRSYCIPLLLCCEVVGVETHLRILLVVHELIIQLTRTYRNI